MKCEEFKNLISSYIEGDCLQEQEFERHMAQCAACRQEFEETKKIVALCRQMPEIPLPEGFAQRLHERLLLEAKPKKSVMIQWKRYKRGFAVGAAAIAASLVFVATPFFSLYNGSGNVSIPNIQDTPGMGIAQGGSQTPESTAAPDMAASIVLPQQNMTQPQQGQQPESSQTNDLPENIAGQETALPKNHQIPEQKAAVQPPVQTPAAAEETPQSAPQNPPMAASGTTVSQPENVPEPKGNAAMASAPSNSLDAVEAHGGGGGSMVMAARGNSEPIVQQISASAENRAWLQENAAGYGSRQTVDSVEIVTLTVEEYRTLLDSNVQHETPQEVPQAAMDLMNADGYYVILK
ncbi:MAG: hypothetical protein HFI90_07715 [Clostridia bacterium]|nr:hypothetical protein [Clostridia bacterium]